MERGYRMRGGDVNIDDLREQFEYKDVEETANQIMDDGVDEMEMKEPTLTLNGDGRRNGDKPTASKPEYDIFDSTEDEAEPGSTRNTKNLGMEDEVEYDSVEVEGDDQEDLRMKRAAVSSSSISHAALSFAAAGFDGSSARTFSTRRRASTALF